MFGTIHERAKEKLDVEPAEEVGLEIMEFGRRDRCHRGVTMVPSFVTVSVMVRERST